MSAANVTGVINVGIAESVRWAVTVTLIVPTTIICVPKGGVQKFAKGTVTKGRKGCDAGHLAIGVGIPGHVAPEGVRKGDAAGHLEMRLTRCGRKRVYEFGGILLYGGLISFCSLRCASVYRLRPVSNLSLLELRSANDRTEQGVV